MKPATWVGLLIILSSAAFGAQSLVKNLTPYVSFQQARTESQTVQVMGALDKTSISTENGKLAFTIISPEGDRMPVRYKAAPSSSFSEAVQVTAIGKFDGQVFQADNLLVKCPSKYKGTETERKYGAAG